MIILKPIRTQNTNVTYGLEGCEDLPAQKMADRIVSTWALPNGDTIDLSIWGQGQPPVSLVLNEIPKDRSLEQLCNKFLEDNDIDCEEDCYQSDKVYENAAGFIEDLYKLLKG